MAKSVVESWKSRLEQPFYGVTSDGVKRPNLFTLQDEGAPTHQVVDAANRLLETLDEDEKSKVSFGLDSEKWRCWCNPEFIIFDNGLRLERLTLNKQSLIMDVLKASLSEEGFRKVQGAIRTNVFLGELCNARGILNAGSYFFMVFGTPSVTEPWGMLFFSHHCCLNFFFLGRQMTISPYFIGAEPNMIDHGVDQGLEICVREEERGLCLMQSLAPEQQAKAQIYKLLHDPLMPPERWNPADQRHLGGAFQDNRIIPYEGVLVSDLSPSQQEAIIGVVASFLELLPETVHEARLQQVRRHLSETYFSWTGGFGNQDSFYYRVQSPVICVEFDHHSGVFLTNDKPMKYHIHTVLRTPNGNDYGREWLKLHRAGCNMS
ncbi:hypothetical protein H2198_002996 [Neophaeococcomyces mojaviensis]|uniref:Uncharacterized protein n=1 Tax=Neophaeococcomyces mojaviensis TaxID=3383035 RepID=A0ACC3ACE7_9EURO|nr:hypothetical protein H2198_002996 [Knufia sp. JES_112]